MLGYSHAEIVGLDLLETYQTEDRELGRFCVKEAVMPFGRFPGADSVLGPEMKSTGEVMAGADTTAEAYARALRASGRGNARGRIGEPLQQLGTAVRTLPTLDRQRTRAERPQITENSP